MMTPSRSGRSCMMLRDSSPVPGGRSMMRYSRLPQLTLERNSLMTRILRGPRQITGVSADWSRNSIETLRMLRGPITGSRPLSPPIMRVPSRPSILGTLGPVMSASRMPTTFPFQASAVARLMATVVLPTPPLPERIAILCLTWRIFSAISCSALLWAPILRSLGILPEDLEVSFGIEIITTRDESDVGCFMGNTFNVTHQQTTITPQIAWSSAID